MFKELLDMPIAYDMGMDLTGLINRKPHRKGSKLNRPPKKEVVVITSKELSRIAGKVLEKMLKKSFTTVG